MYSSYFYYFLSDYFRFYSIGRNLEYEINHEYAKLFPEADKQNNSSTDKVKALNNLILREQYKICQYIYENSCNNTRELYNKKTTINVILTELYKNPIFQSLYLNDTGFDLDSLFKSKTLSFDELTDIFPFNVKIDQNENDLT